MNKLQLFTLHRFQFNHHLVIIIVLITVIAAVYYVWYDSWYDRYEWFWRFSIFEFRNDLIGSLFLIPFIYASLVFWWQGSFFVWLVSLFVAMPRMVNYSFDPAEVARNVTLSSVPLMIIMTITLELKWRERQKKILMERENERQLYMSQILRAQELERYRIAQELHDDTTQELLAIANRVHQAITTTDDTDNGSNFQRDFEWVRDAVLHVSENVRRISLDLRPSILDNMGLIPALRWLVQRLDEETDINAKFKVTGNERKLNSETEVTVFRIVQEALSNIRRHSKASSASVDFRYGQESIEITVRDNGQGFSAGTENKIPAVNKSGIIGMQQRARLIGATCEIRSRPSKGTSVLIRIENLSNLGADQAKE